MARVVCANPIVCVHCVIFTLDLPHINTWFVCVLVTAVLPQIVTQFVYTNQIISHCNVNTREHKSLLAFKTLHVSVPVLFRAAKL